MRQRIQSQHIKNGDVEPEFGKLLVTLAEVLGVTISETRLRAYAHLLGDVTLAEVRQACERSANEPRDPSKPVYYPTPGQLRGYLQSSIDDQAVVAWTSMCRAVEKFGAYASVIVYDSAAAEALRSVFSSWADFCHTDEGPILGARRSEFIARYKQIRRLKKQGPPQRLPGLCESSGSYDATKPVVVGHIGESLKALPEAPREAITKADAKEGVEAPRQARGSGRDPSQ